jgi:hypothetical protein
VTYLAAIAARQKATAPAVAPVPKTEAQRICALPIEHYLDVDLTDELRKKGTTRLRPIQSQALAAIRDTRGGLFPIGVGWGKSLIALLAGAVLESKLALILCPASTVNTLRKTYMEWSLMYRMPPTRILSYSQLSRPEGTAILDELIAGYQDSDIVLVCDECHRLKRREAARTKRVLRFMRARHEVAFVALSGTITSKSLCDFGHLSELALRHHSPVPRNRHTLNAWAAVIDVEGHPTRTDVWEARPLKAWALANHIDMPPTLIRSIRHAFQHRLRSAPGVVASDVGALGCSLVLHPIRDLEIPAEVQHWLDLVEHPGTDPQGDPLPDDLSAWRVRRQLTCGFYYRWDWPEGIEDTEWMEARADWNRQVRGELQHRARAGYDSPFLVATEVQRHIESGRRLRALHRSWIAWDAERHKPPPPREAVWVDTYLVEHAVAWARAQREPVAIWYDGHALEDAFRAMGVPTYAAGQEPPAEAETCALSIKANGIGKNLQQWSTALVLTWQGGELTEQLLGRHHRPGQAADEVHFHLYAHAPAFARALDRSKVEARYIEDVSGNIQKLTIATWA